MKNDIGGIQRRWKLLQIETSMACNIHCVMCPWIQFRKNAVNGGLMTQSVWDAIHPYLEDAETVDLSGGGEPILHPNIVQWAAEAHNAGCNVGFLTNGTLLDADCARMLVEAGIHWIGVSIDGATPDVYEKIRYGAHFYQVINSIQTLASLRRNGLPRIIVQFVMMRENVHQIVDMVHLCASINADCLVLKHFDVSRDNQDTRQSLLTGKTRADIKIARNIRKAYSLAKKYGISILSFSRTPHQQPVCAQNPAESVFIRYDGIAAPCINLAYGGAGTFFGKSIQFPDIHYGNVSDEGLESIWETSQSCAFYRERFSRRRDLYMASIEKSHMYGIEHRSERMIDLAISEMPDPPRACKTCHYLYYTV